MTLVVVPHAADAALVVATAVQRLLRDQPTAVLGLAAGTSPLGAYRLLRRHRAPLAAATLVLLDEYLGLGPDHEAGFRHQLGVELIDPLRVPDERVLALDGLTDDAAAECRRFEAALTGLGGVELQLLGIGRNGHIAFNEPGTPHDSRSHLVELSEGTRRDNAAAFESLDAVPHQALTQGIGTILEARHLLLLATGAHKAPAVAAALEGPVDRAVPASALQRHPSVTYVLDEAAAERLTRR